MDLIPRPILITLIPIRDTTRAWGWHGVRPDLRWVLGPAEPGATATGVTVTSTLTTTITLTVATSTGAISTAARRAAVSGNTIPNIAVTHLMVIGEQPASSVDVARVGPVVRAVLVVLEDR